MGTKTYCKPKDTHIEDVEFNLPAVTRCIFGAPGKPSKLGRKDFRRYLASMGVATEEELRAEHEAGIYDKTYAAVYAVAESLTEDIRNRDLHLAPVRQFQRRDGLSGKERSICQESPAQQVHEYILVGALLPLFRAKFLPIQYGSIPGRGPEMGKRKIERIVRRLCKGGKAEAVQGDVQKAYPSTTTECVMMLLRRDIGKNKALLWYAAEVMSNYPGGVLLIGGYFSSYAFNYVMSYLLRYLLSLGQSRRGKFQRYIRAAACYADDFIAFGRISQLKKAMKKATSWAKSTLGLTVRASWKVIRMPGFDSEKRCKAERLMGSKKRTAAIDMMGYVVRGTYTIIRKRIFRRLRRQVIRAEREYAELGYVPWWRALSLTGTKGRIRNSDSKGFSRIYGVRKILKSAGRSISVHARKGVKRYEAAVCTGAC